MCEYVQVIVTTTTCTTCTKGYFNLKLVDAREHSYIFLAQLIAILNSYPHIMSAVAKLKWSAFLGGEFATL